MAKIERRTFIGTVGAAAAGATFLGDAIFARPAHAASGNVYSVYDPGMVTGTSPSSVQEAAVKAALDACIKAMTGKSSVGAAWEAVFPGVTTAKKIAIKINCLKAAVSPQLATIKALVQGLTAMCGGSFPAGNIYLYDNTLPFQGLTSNRLGAIYGASQLNALGIVHVDPSPQYAGSTFKVRGANKVPAAYLNQADYGIGLVPLKRHQYYGGGITGVIKNMMGACSAATGSYSGADGTFHDGSPYTSFVDLFKNYMKAKLQVYLVDMLFAAATENASGWSKVVNRITLGTDPCAVDAYFADELNKAGIAGTKAVPNALASAGLGTTSYSLVNVPVGGPSAPTRDSIDAKIRDRRSGKASDADVKSLIKGYRVQK